MLLLSQNICQQHFANAHVRENSDCQRAIVITEKNITTCLPSIRVKSNSILHVVSSLYNLIVRHEVGGLQHAAHLIDNKGTLEADYRQTHVCIHTFIHYIALRYIALHCRTVRYGTSQYTYITLLDVTLHHITSHHINYGVPIVFWHGLFPLFLITTVKRPKNKKKQVSLKKGP